RDLVVAAAKNNGRGVGEADLRGAGRNLLYRIRRSLPAHDLDIEILPGIVAFFERNEIIGMSSVVAEISDEGHLVRGLGVSLSEGAHADRGEHQRNAKLPAAMHCRHLLLPVRSDRGIFRARPACIRASSLDRRAPRPQLLNWANFSIQNSI